ncbi:ABC transporter ATP-binding protein [Acuticoccus mangrovi]|uniref:ABC transporter ATP-binding protein n=1 Tax=Acuticoccus mangrovi TaxID=2796142 RepID=A0A934IQM4_9HYPH|nr:ABC transporter ATP-binding protein [Acuticoccus mangrovi]MBJ3776916.1 ABC transporter ATP-binding protein [Acuticoccus mangrovi]
MTRVVIDNLSKVYKTRRDRIHALDRISLTIGEGEFVSVVGPSGCGKSTLMSLVSGLEFPTSGEVSLDGVPIRAPITDVGIVFQTDVLLEWRTVLSNVMIQAEMRKLDRATYRARAEELLRTTGLDGFGGKYPHELSGGMRQRASICRALVHDPSLLLMDEPFGALDALTREMMVLELHRLWLATRKSILFITHDIEEAVFLADRVVVMTPRPGRIAEIITPNLPEARDMRIKQIPEFGAAVGRIRTIFEETGILKTI